MIFVSRVHGQKPKELRFIFLFCQVFKPQAVKSRNYRYFQKVGVSHFLSKQFLLMSDISYITIYIYIYITFHTIKNLKRRGRIPQVVWLYQGRHSSRYCTKMVIWSLQRCAYRKTIASGYLFCGQINWTFFGFTFVAFIWWKKNNELKNMAPTVNMEVEAAFL